MAILGFRRAVLGITTAPAILLAGCSEPSSVTVTLDDPVPLSVSAEDRDLLTRCVAKGKDDPLAIAAVRKQYKNIDYSDPKKIAVVLDKAHGHVDKSLPLGYDPGASFIRIDDPKKSAYALSLSVSKSMKDAGISVDHKKLRETAEVVFQGLNENRKDWDLNDNFYNADTEVIVPLIERMGWVVTEKKDEELRNAQIKIRHNFYKSVWQYADERGLLLSEALVSDALMGRTEKMLKNEGVFVFSTRPYVTEISKKKTELTGNEAKRATMVERVAIPLMLMKGMGQSPILISGHLDVVGNPSHTISAGYTISPEVNGGIVLPAQVRLTRSVSMAWKQGLDPKTALGKKIETVVKEANFAVPRCGGTAMLLESIQMNSVEGRARAWNILKNVNGAADHAARSLLDAIKEFVASSKKPINVAKTAPRR